MNINNQNDNNNNNMDPSSADPTNKTQTIIIDEKTTVSTVYMNENTQECELDNPDAAHVHHIDAAQNIRTPITIMNLELKATDKAGKEDEDEEKKMTNQKILLGEF
eukprot:UN23093